VREEARLLKTASARTEIAYGLSLFLATVASRVPFRSQILYHWDSVNFANAMRHFDVLQEYPQPPGYIVYVWLCRLVDWLFHDANATMVWISVITSALAVVTLYLVGKTMYDRRVGLVAALLLASSPLFWFYGEIALPHTLDTFLVLLAVWLLFRVQRGEHRLVWPATVVLATAGGVRQQTLIFLLPLAFYAFWEIGLKRWLLAGLLGAILCLAWFAPLMASCGGIGAYLAETSTFGARFQRSTSVFMGAGWDGVVHNLRKLGIYTTYGASVALIPFGVYGLARLSRQAWPYDWGRLVFLGLWTTPALLFYSLIHMGQQGLIFVFLPALLLLAALAAVHLAKGSDQTICAVVAAAMIVNACVFGVAPELPLGPGGQRLLTRRTLENSDRYFLDRFAAIRRSFAPEHTAIMALRWSHLEYYLPLYAFLRVDEVSQDNGVVMALRQWPWGKDDTLSFEDLQLEPSPTGLVIVLYDRELRTLMGDAIELQGMTLANGGDLTYFRLGSHQALVRYGRTLRIEEGD